MPEHDAFEESSDSLFRHTNIKADLPLLVRAWAFQEHILSPRVIQFGQHDIIWEYKQTMKCSCGHGQFPVGPKSRLEDFIRNRNECHDMAAPVERLQMIWTDIIVKNYARRVLTYSSDRLAALSGIAKVLHSRYQCNYLAGLWETDLVDGLCWSVLPQDETAERLQEYIAPSWSWASVNGPGSWTPLLDKDSQNGLRAEIVQAHCTLKTNNPFGAVKDGRLAIRGAVLQGQLSSRDMEDRSRIYFVRVNGVREQFDADFRLDTHQTNGSEATQEYYLIRLSQAAYKDSTMGTWMPWVRGLVLIKRGPYFERIGYFNNYGLNHPNWFRNVEDSTITIVWILVGLKLSRVGLRDIHCSKSVKRHCNYVHTIRRLAFGAR